MSLSTRAVAAITALATSVVVLASAPASHANNPDDAPTGQRLYLSTPAGVPLHGNFCAGATDPQGDPISVAEATVSSSHQLTYDTATCNYTFTPGALSPDAHQVQTIFFKLTDGTNVSPWQAHHITVGRPGNAPVIAQPKTFTIGKDRWLLFRDKDAELTAGDVDPEGAPVSVYNMTNLEHLVSQPAASLISQSFLPGEEMLGVPALGDRAMRYRPPTGFVGERRLVYSVTDGVNRTEQVFTIVVTDPGPFQNPVAKDDHYEVPRNQKITVTEANGLLVNDHDPDSTLFRVAGYTDPKHGTISDYNSYTGTFTYTPDPGFTGIDSMKYYLVDGEDNISDLATVTFEVKTMSPVAVDDHFQVSQDTPLVIPVSSLTANDHDPDSEFSIAGFFPATFGTVAWDQAAGTITYTPNPGYSGGDEFAYRLNDPDGNYSNWATVSITVVAAGQNHPPVAHNDSYQVRRGGVLVVPAHLGPLANDTDADGDTIEIDSVDPPAHGSFTAFDKKTGAFTYVPAPNWQGVVTVGYRAIDSEGNMSGTATITITVFNDPPVAHDDHYETVVDVPLVVPASSGLLANDVDLEGEKLRIISITLPQHGAVDYDQHTGAFTYTPKPGFTGVDTFTYRIRDEALQESGPATVTITVAPGKVTTATPTIGGTFKVGERLTASPGTWSPEGVTLSYQWLRNGKPIPAATGPSYRLAAADLNTTVSVRVTGERQGFASAHSTSTAKTVQPGTLQGARPKIRGTARPGRSLRAAAGTWGPGEVTLRYQWLRNGKRIKGATKQRYRLTQKDKGRRITVRVTGRKTGYTTLSRTPPPPGVG
ncbi:Ig-like domain-containing protein [Nocardioides limicola]|uniref:Ig-like domain-containing protein n=1 Tax=Nocardioides limicola TaxID=2803368 RepID=UPI00193B643F|nr:Ig-like domain-containing protein [Nocardioides sp. DJM-14]